MKLFKNVKQIKSKSGDLHFNRLAIIETFIFAIYIHTIYREDKDPFWHSHPWNFLSIILNGEYVEEFKKAGHISSKIKKRFSLGFGKRNYYHRIIKLVKRTTTLFFTFGRKKPWYFMTNYGRVESQEYINNKSKYNN